MSGNQSPAGAEAQPLVAIRDVTIDYGPAGRRGRGVRAVEDFSADVFAGEKLVILGPSGCGKSTLLMALAGFIPITSGSMMLESRKIEKPGLDRAMVFQDFGQLLPWKTVRDNVAFAIGERWPGMGRRERLARAAQYVELVGLTAQREQYPHTLSGGQKQRVAIARALSVSPSVLLMDEPFGALDAINRERMQEELNRIWEADRPTVVFVTHDVNEAVHLGHRILVMTAGPGRVNAIIENAYVGLNAFDADGLQLRSELRNLLKERVARP